MSNIIYLKDHKELALKIALKINSSTTWRNSRGSYKEEHIKKALETLTKSNLRYNKNNDTLYLKREWISRPNESDITKNKYDNIEEVVEWEFVNEILNVAGRLEREAKAI